MSSAVKTIYTIPAGVPFARALAAKILADVGDRPEKLAEYRILLPTRRACRALRDVFLQLTQGKPVLLPHMHPVGDMDEEELSLTLFEGRDLGLKPGITPLRRQILLARAIEKTKEFSQGPAQAMKLAQALGRFLDQIIIEERDLADLQSLVPADFADHWQITLNFLKILSEVWPGILDEQGVLDSAERRRELTYALARHWRDHPLETPVIAAGSTGSMPATATLLSAIAEMPQGSVILPGLDQDMDQDSWHAIEESHPQYGLKHLLSAMVVEREAVDIWPISEDYEDRVTHGRRFLAREMMRPVETSAAWQDLAISGPAQDTIQSALENFRSFDCENGREEAQLIALLIRETLQEPGRTFVLITPDRHLARQVSVFCQRWGIDVDDSAGQILSQSDAGTFLRLVADACLKNFKPVALLSLLKHKFCFFDHNYETFRKTVDRLDTSVLRGTERFENIGQLSDYIQMLDDPEIKNLMTQFEPITRSFATLIEHKEPQNFSKFLQEHIKLAEGLNSVQSDEFQPDLWSGEAGEAAAIFLADLMSHAEILPFVTAQEYVDIFTTLMEQISVRPKYGAHPRVLILGQLEARLVEADVTVLASLNEGSWPPDPGHDPWMSRPMRKAFGLPALERSIGLAAHDFVQAFCAGNVVLTRAKRVQGMPTVPARWLQRLGTVLQATGAEKLDTAYYKDWLAALDHQDDVAPITRPAPCPPLEKRPSQLSVTKIETWLKDPYQIYARAVLGLKKLDPLEKPLDAAGKGSVLHAILDRFVTQYPNDLPARAEDLLIQIARNELEDQDFALWQYWWPRFDRVAHDFVNHEKEWRKTAKPVKTEAKGILNCKNFTLTAVADRIDRKNNGNFAIIDYKSGGTYTKADIKTGKRPQLPLEAMILLGGGFNDVPAGAVEVLSYWTLTGGRKSVDITQIDGDLSDVIERAQQGLADLVAAFQAPDTPYYSIPRLDEAPRFNDYAHLARVKEWAALDGDMSEEAA